MSRNPGLNQLGDVVVGVGPLELLEQLHTRDAGAVVVVAAPAVGVIQGVTGVDILLRVTVLLRPWRAGGQQDGRGNAERKQPKGPMNPHGSGL